MTGAIIGDIIGSTYERHNVKTRDFELFPQDSCFTDDSVIRLRVLRAELRIYIIGRYRQKFMRKECRFSMSG